MNNYVCRLNLWCPTTKARRNSCACYSINSKDCLCKRCGEICWKGYYSSVFQTYQNDRTWLNISPFNWVSLFSRVHWRSALSDLLASLIPCMNPFAKSVHVWCDRVCGCVCEEAIPAAFTSARPAAVWGDGASETKGYNTFKIVKPESNIDEKVEKSRNVTQQLVNSLG